ncbi:hypothetical protein LO771_06780 [Streptacidiphilus sp. ASG 303]|nr:hypothetical protein [Streptacidiphilus sp. ASG 303]MCD0482128.1 hypothetical protein [Streptacidiphilus sp. ASG 303]
MLNEVDQVFEVARVAHAAVDVHDGDGVLRASAQVREYGVPDRAHHPVGVGAVRQLDALLAEGGRVVLDCLAADASADGANVLAQVVHLVGDLLGVAFGVLRLTRVQHP